ncbi:chorismate mutase [Bartonella bovis]|uniref:Chorismate mutase n=1 Tax=Bartonella bovis m02 TaxID=1094492 RepID=N6UIN7_9HYPH|nr:chorismate mutase [Bartonella bovis]ENN90093.1 chorismate mutase [Bartonella bovis m02]
MQRKIPNNLAHLRTSIDNLGAALVCILAKCFYYIQAVGGAGVKARYNLSIVYVTCEQSQAAGLQQLGVDNCLDPDFAENFLNFITKSDSLYNYC